LLFSDGAVRNVAVMGIVAPGADSKSTHRFAAGCSPSSQLNVVFRTLYAGFVATELQPTKVEVQVKDSCGDPVTRNSGASVVAGFDNGDPQLSLNDTGGGIWSGTWQPKNASRPQVGIRAYAIRGGANRAGGEQFVSVAVRRGTTIPIIRPGSVLNSASLVEGNPVAPGSWISIFGERLADAADQSSSPQLELGRTKVLLGQEFLKLMYVSENQVNALIPFELKDRIDTEHQVIVVRNSDVASVPEELPVAAAQPAIFTVDATGRGQGVIRHENGSTADAQSPAAKGETVVIYCSGLGEEQPDPASIEVTIGGWQAAASRVTLAGPTLPGVYEVVTTVPENTGSGDQIPVIVKKAGHESPVVTMSIR
jgi:uncharacterized protein (TIGR03437 family)